MSNALTCGIEIIQQIRKIIVWFGVYVLVFGPFKHLFKGACFMRGSWYAMCFSLWSERVRKWIHFALISLLAGLVACDRLPEKKVALDVPSSWTELISDDFSKRDSAWKTLTGKWAFSNGMVKQTSVSDDFPLILHQAQQFSEIDISVAFRPVSGRVDASGGVVFRAEDRANYYVVRANSLENNFRLYTVKKGVRDKIASVKVVPPALGKFHVIRIVAIGDHIQAYLNNVLLLDHHDDSFARGFVGLWTKADAVTEFDNLQVSGKE